MVTEEVREKNLIAECDICGAEILIGIYTRNKLRRKKSASDVERFKQVHANCIEEDNIEDVEESADIMEVLSEKYL